MRKLFTSLLAVVVTLSVFAQGSIQVRTKKGVDKTNGTYNVSGPSTANTINAYLVLENVGNSPITVRALRREVSIVSGMDNAMCFGFTCNTWASGSNPIATFPDDSLMLQPGDTDLTSYLQTYPKGNQGCETYKAKFWVSANTSDSSTVLINACTWTTGLAEIKANKNVVLATPNPANDRVQIAYNIADSRNLAELRVYNVVGEELKRTTLSGKQGAISLDVSTMSPGIHFYTLVIDGEIQATKKLIITR